MWNQPHNAYAESRIMTADPMELVRLMYLGAMAEVRNAIVHLQNRDVRARANSISKARAILTELTVALDRKSGGEYAERLADLYGYMSQKLTEANFRQREEPLAEVLGLLTTIVEGWEGAQKQLASQSAAGAASSDAVPASLPVGAWAAEQSGYTSQAWSF
jgi:flagellar secretion chaperone FliS